MPLRFAKSDRYLMEIKAMETLAINLANLIFYDKLDGCICYNEHLASCITTVLSAMNFQVYKEIDEKEQLYRMWVKRS